MVPVLFLLPVLVINMSVIGVVVSLHRWLNEGAAHGSTRRSHNDGRLVFERWRRQPSMQRTQRVQELNGSVGAGTRVGLRLVWDHASSDCGSRRRR
jgi:hypothetical protein